MKNSGLALGIGGTVVAALCCFTPFLPFVLTALGPTGLLGVVYTDAVLLSVLAISLVFSGYALWRKKRHK